MPKKLILGLIVLLVLTVVSKPKAVPVFARKTNLSCSKCHTAFPKLNAFGREFKVNGYKRTGEQEKMQDISTDLSLEKNFPAAVYLKVRPYDKKKTNDKFKLRSMHEVELFFAGTADEVFSYFAEVEAEDETGFAPVLGLIEFGYHPSLLLNFLLSNKPVSVSDPFQTISNEGKLTRSDKSIFVQGFATGEMPAEKQTFSIYGTTEDRKIFYSLGVSADMQGTDGEGAGPKDTSARFAYTLPMGLTLGAFYNSGKENVSDSTGAGAAEELKFNRTVLDFQFEKEKFTLSGAYLMAKDNKHSLDGGGSESNKGFYLEGFFVNKIGKGEEERPSFVPLIRFDKYETDNGTKDYEELTVNLTHYFKENAKVYLEYWAELKKPAGAKNNRLTLQAEIGF